MTYTDHLFCEPWTTVGEVRSCCSRIDCSTIEDVLIEEAIQVATDFLFAATAKQFSGICTQEIRPCVDCNCDCYWSDPCVCCKNYSRIDLGLWPIVEILEVDVAGSLLPVGEFHVESHRWLVRTPQPPDYLQVGWPTCQRMDRPKGAPETFTITVSYGIEPPPLARRAARELACAWISCFNNGPCALPSNVKSIVRQGVEYDLQSSTDSVVKGLTGIQAVDQFIQIYNPQKLVASSFVWSPDLPTNNHVRWT